MVEFEAATDPYTKKNDGMRGLRTMSPLIAQHARRGSVLLPMLPRSGAATSGTCSNDEVR